MRTPVFFVVLGMVGLVAIHGMYYGGHTDPPMPAMDPVYLSWKDLRASIKSEPPKAIVKRGKIGIRGIYLFINEPNMGMHIFDNHDPASPKAIAFVKIPGNLDIAIKGDVLFADSFVDLVAIDISALPAIKELNRQVDVFPYDATQTADGEYYYGGAVDKNLGVVIGWKNAARAK
jgi:hypothetical protein